MAQDSGKDTIEVRDSGNLGQVDECVIRFMHLFSPWTVSKNERCPYYIIEDLAKTAAIITPQFEKELKPVFSSLTILRKHNNKKDLLIYQGKMFWSMQFYNAIEVVKARKIALVEFEGTSMLALKGERTIVITSIEKLCETFPSRVINCKELFSTCKNPFII